MIIHHLDHNAFALGFINAAELLILVTLSLNILLHSCRRIFASSMVLESAILLQYHYDITI